jgi:translocation and assembly module TamB
MVRWVLPVQLTAAQIRTEDGALDDQLRHVRAAGTLTLNGMRLSSEDVALAIPHGTARASVQVDLAKGDWVVQGKAGLHGWPLSIGAADAQGRVRVAGARNAPWRVNADITGGIPNLTNGTLANLTGGPLRFAGHVDMTQGNRLAVTRGRIDRPVANDAGRGAWGRWAHRIDRSRASGTLWQLYRRYQHWRGWPAWSGPFAGPLPDVGCPRCRGRADAGGRGSAD